MIGNLSKDTLARFQTTKPAFLKVQESTGVPWQAIAGVWFRESFSVSPPKTPGGPFQFDPPLNSTQIALLLQRYSRLTTPEIINMSDHGVDHFVTAAYCCAAFLRNKIKPVITVNASDAIMKEAFWAYNGKAYGSADKSPYVMNMFDEAHKHMRLIGTIPDGHGGRKQINTIDRRPGAFTIYKHLKDIDL